MILVYLTSPFIFSSQQKEAEFFSKIIDIQQLRVAPEYFMVGYYGKGFPLFLRVMMSSLCRAVYIYILCRAMASLHVATLTVHKELRLYLASRSLPYLYTKNETMAPLHVDTLTVKRELPKYEIIYLYSTSVPRMKPWLHFMRLH